MDTEGGKREIHRETDRNEISDAEGRMSCETLEKQDEEPVDEFLFLQINKNQRIKVKF